MIQARLREMRLAQISLKDRKPTRQVKANRPKHQGHQEGDSTVQSGAWGQLGAGSQELGQLVQLEPGVSGIGEPDTTHDDHKTGEGADDDGVQEHA